MPKTKISEFSATPGNNTDIDGINISEGCAPSGINDAIRELMAQLKDFQAGTAGDSFNGPIGATTPAAGTFTNLSASGTFALTGDQVQISEGGTGQTTANAAFNALAPSQTSQAGKYLKTDGTNTSWDAIDINTADITGTLPIANGGTGLTALGTGVQTALGQNVTGSGGIVLASSPSLTTPNLGTPSAVTLTNATGLPLSTGVTGTLATTNGGTGLTSFTANGVVYASSTSALTTGSALTFNGSSFVTLTASGGTPYFSFNRGGGEFLNIGLDATGAFYNTSVTNTHRWLLSGGVSEGMRLTSTGLGIGTSSPSVKLDVQGGSINTSSFVTITPTTTTLNAIYRATNTGGTFYAGLDNSAGGVTGTAYAAMLWHTGAYPISFGTNNTLRATLDSSGNLGLGVTPSAWGAGLKGIDVGAGSALVNPGSSAATWLLTNAYSDGTLRYKNSSVGASYYQQQQGVHSWYTAASGTAGNAISFTQAMTLDANANLLINTTSLTRRVSVGVASAASLNTSDDGVVVSNATSRIQIGVTGASYTYGGMGADSGLLYSTNRLSIGADANNPITFHTGSPPAERARITSVGNLSLGGTANRGTTVGTNAIQIFNGTAPAGTLTNGVSLYSSSGDLNFMNSAGNGFKVGYRNLPPVGTQTGSYTLAAADAGKYVQVGSGGSITVPTSVFAEGDAITLYNNTTGNITITCSAVTAYTAGTNTVKTSMTLATRGVATILFYSATACVISGNVT